MESSRGGTRRLSDNAFAQNGQRLIKHISHQQQKLGTDVIRSSSLILSQFLYNSAQIPRTDRKVSGQVGRDRKEGVFNRFRQQDILGSPARNEQVGFVLRSTATISMTLLQWREERRDPCLFKRGFIVDHHLLEDLGNSSIWNSSLFMYCRFYRAGAGCK